MRRKTWYVWIGVVILVTTVSVYLNQSDSESQSEANEPAQLDAALPRVQVAGDVGTSEGVLIPGNREEPVSLVLASDVSPSDYYRHPTRPYGVAGFAFFKSLVRVSNGANSDAAVSTIRRATGVDEATAQKFLDYAKSAVSDHDEYFAQLTRETCSRADDFQSIPQLAAEFNRTRDAIEYRRVRWMRGASAIFGEEGLRKLDSYLDRHSSSSKFVETDYERELLATGRTPKELLRDSCGA